jgi:hypothetical protein
MIIESFLIIDTMLEFTINDDNRPKLINILVLNIINILISNDDNRPKLISYLMISRTM